MGVGADPLRLRHDECANRKIRAGSVQKPVTSSGPDGAVSCRVCVERDARPGRRPP